MKISPIKIQIKVLTKKADIGKHLSTIERDMESESNPKCRELQLDYYRLIQTIGSREAITRRFLVIFEYRVLNRAWDALSPDSFLNPYKVDYQWLSRVYESVKPTDGRGGLIWASLGAKTIELVHQNVIVGEADEDMDIKT